MDLSKQEDRWAVWTVQARNFAKRESYTDAVARMKLVRDSIEQARGRVTDAKERARLERHLARADEQLATLKARYEAWRSEIAVRRQSTINHAAEEMARPLPTAAR
jgi:chromosome segregation ATPase